MDRYGGIRNEGLDGYGCKPCATWCVPVVCVGCGGLCGVCGVSLCGVPAVCLDIPAICLCGTSCESCPIKPTEACELPRTTGPNGNKQRRLSRPVHYHECYRGSVRAHQRDTNATPHPCGSRHHHPKPPETPTGSATTSALIVADRQQYLFIARATRHNPGTNNWRNPQARSIITTQRH